MDEVRPENADTIVVAHAATRTRRTYYEFEVGTIVVDVFDTQSKTAVRHGFASRVLHDDAEKDADQTDRAVRQIFEQYPV